MRLFHVTATVVGAVHSHGDDDLMPIRPWQGGMFVSDLPFL